MKREKLNSFINLIKIFMNADTGVFIQGNVIVSHAISFVTSFNKMEHSV